MRKILIFTDSANTACSVVARLAKVVAFGTGFAITMCSGSAKAQNLTDYSSRANVQSAAATSPANQPLGLGMAFSGAPTVDASYSLMCDASRTEQASFHNPISSSGNYVSDACSAGCDLSWYAGYDALFLRRENDERFSLSRNSFLPDFEYEFGGRYTIGRLFDCVNGWEAVYAGPFDWNRQSSVVGAANLQSQFQPLGGYLAADIDSFNDADQHLQSYRASLQSFELNRRWWSWDVISTMIGVRYIDYEEDFLFNSINAANGDGLFVERVDNQMIGAQVGADIMYPVTLRTTAGIRGKAGVYANFAERQTFLSNNGATLLNAGENDTDVAGVIEGGVFTNYQVIPSVRLTAGYEFWYLPNMVTIPDQSPSLISPGSGTSIEQGSDLFFHGGSVGVQVLF